MAGSGKDTGVAAFIPHRWRMLTAAGVATVGLACCVAKPALAEWWKLSKADRSATVSQPVPVENGFAGTIRRLTAESRRASEQGDHVKAVQLAERAAKISEAAAQVVGPQGECSPQETARFLAQARARRNGAAIAAQPASQPVRHPKRPVATVPQQQLASSRSLPPRPRPLRDPIPQQARQVTQPAAKPQTATVASATEATGTARPSRSTDLASAGTASLQPKEALPPSPSPTADDLLAQSRLEAADGRFDRAIALAEQAIAASSSGSLFGTASQPANPGEALRWRNHLVTQRDASVLAAAAPVNQAASPSASQTARTWDEGAIEQPAPQAAAAAIASVTTPPNRAKATESQWTEDLPPAPTPRPKHIHEMVQFRRSEISRQGEWIDAATIEATTAGNLRAENDAAATEPTESTGDEPTAVQETADTLSEFPIVESIAPEATDEPASEQPAAPATEVLIVDREKPSMEPAEALPATRPPLKLRGKIQQVAAAFPDESSSAKETPERVLAETEKSPFDVIAEPQPQPKSRLQIDAAKPPSSDDFIDATTEEPTAEIPVQRFPVQRVLQLRERLQTAATFNPGASKSESPLTPAASPTETPNGATTKAASWDGGWQSAEPVAPARPDSAATIPSKRPSLKLRERLPVVAGETDDPSPKAATVVAKPVAIVRPKVIGHSEIAHWKSADAQPAAKEQHSLSEAPGSSVSQIGYEAPIVPPSAEESIPPEEATVAPAPPEWFDDGLVRKRAASSVVVRKRSFTLIDQLADTLKVPVSTAVSLIGVGGFVLFGIGLMAVRSALRKRHES